MASAIDFSDCVIISEGSVEFKHSHEDSLEKRNLFKSTYYMTFFSIALISLTSSSNCVDGIERMLRDKCSKRKNVQFMNYDPFTGAWRIKVGL
jgi:hypothetical protein